MKNEFKVAHLAALCMAVDFGESHKQIVEADRPDVVRHMDAYLRLLAEIQEIVQKEIETDENE